MFWLILILIFDFGICWWNAVVAGKVWIDSKAVGGFIRVVAWSAAIQAAAGFTMIFGFLLAGGAYAFGYPKVASLLADFDYLLVILPILGSGLIITAHSWIAAYRDRSIANVGTAAYNTFAMGYDSYEAVTGIGDVIGDIWKNVSSDDDDDGPWVGVALFLLLIALGCGIFLTIAIMKHNMATLPRPERPIAAPNAKRYA